MLLDDRNYSKASVPKVTPELEAARKQVDRILASKTLHASEVLRRLLRFLADKTFAGEADDLKEYSVGLDALGKPSTYDPRQDAGVRLQASRLRQKLDEYYHSEGKDDLLVVELRKGRFKIAWHPKDGGVLPAAGVQPLPAVAAPPGPRDTTIELRNLKKWRALAVGLAAALLLLAFACVWTLSLPSRTLGAKPVSSVSTPELDALWSPFLSAGHRHLIIAFINPLFVRLERKGGPDIIYRTRGNNSWNDAVSSPEFSVLSRSLGNPSVAPTFNMVERSSLVSTFALSQFFATRRSDISLARSSEFTWQRFADNDVILLAPLKIDQQGGSALPVQPALVVEKDGVRNLRPLAGEPPLYADPQDHQDSDGEGLELVSVLPGPMRRTTVMTFSSNHAWGVIGGVQSLTDPAFARVLVKKLRESSGKIPLYYQVVFKIEYRDGTPTNASYVTHRVLTLTQNSNAATGEN